jgi:hypothetical protein
MSGQLFNVKNRSGLGLSLSPKVGLGPGFLIYKTQSPSPTGQKMGKAKWAGKFSPSGPKKILLVFFSKVL